ncbi:MAG: PAS domain S-box protein [Polyangiaceae bacterium]
MTPSEPPPKASLAPESVAHLRFFQAMDRVNQAILRTSDDARMLTDVLDICLDVFECHRAWLVYPCEPAAPTWRFEMERTRPGFEGPFPLGEEIPMTPLASATHALLLGADGPVRHLFGRENAIPEDVSARYGFRSQLGMAIYPQGEKPYVFGLHQCTDPREWTAEEELLFQQVGRRLADALTRVHAFRGLKESEERYRGILDNATDACLLIDEEGVIQDVNRSACVNLGYSREEVIGRTPELFDPELTSWKLKFVLNVVAEGRELALDSRNRRKDGTEFPVELRARRMDREGGGFWAVAVLRDMTDRRRAEEEIKHGEQRLRSFFQTSDAGMIEIDPTARITQANEAFAAMLGYTVSEVTAMRVTDFIFPEDMASMVSRYESLRDRKTEHEAREQRYRRKDGSPLLTLSHVGVLGRDADGLPLALSAVLIDLTERKRLEERLQRAQKMEAIGQLAGGVAHDFNNLLTVINGYSDLLLASFPVSDHLHDAAAAIRDASERASRLTSQLLAFSRKAVVEPEVLDLNAVIETTTKMLGRLVGEGITLQSRLTKPLSAVRADAGQIEQVLLNLAVNARDAMPSGGALTIATDEVDVGPDGTWGGEDVRPGRYVRLRVSDTGTGMSEEVRARLFEPFFTTKGIGRGTGLGLATVYGIVRQAGGHISAESRIGEGSEFTVLLPSVSAGLTPLPRESRPSSRGSETILLVEDEPAVRKLTRKILERHGYTVIEATDGDDGLRIAQAHEGAIDLLLTDVVMPTLGGRDLAEALRKQRPALKVLFMTGFTDDAVLRHGISTSADALLQKPFTPAALADKLRLVLDGKDFPESHV